ncbi:hypothetical protein MRX96_012779 [Rhipicephalus microplus]
MAGGRSEQWRSSLQRCVAAARLDPVVTLRTIAKEAPRTGRRAALRSLQGSARGRSKNRNAGSLVELRVIAAPKVFGGRFLSRRAHPHPSCPCGHRHFGSEPGLLCVVHVAARMHPSMRAYVRVLSLPTRFLWQDMTNARLTSVSVCLREDDGCGIV